MPEIRSPKVLSSMFIPSHKQVVKYYTNLPSAIFNDPERLQQDFPVPICQCVQIKQLGNASAGEGGAERYRVVLSDVKNFVQSMLATR